MLLLVAALVAGGSRVVGGLVWIYPVAAAFIGSIVADIGSLFISQLVSRPARPRRRSSTILMAALLNAAIVGLLLVPARALAARYAPEDAPAW